MKTNTVILVAGALLALVVLQSRKALADATDNQKLSLSVKNGLASMGAAPWARNAMGWPVDYQNQTQAIWTNGQQTTDYFSGMVDLGSGLPNAFSTF